MELKWLQDYVALVKHGSFSKAAEARFVTQPAFSRRIRSLENWLGCALVDRDQYPASLTPAGEAFKEQAQQLITQMLAARNQVQQISANRAQLLFRSQQALAVSFFPNWMHTLAALADQAIVKMETGDLHDSIESFLAGNGDFLLCYAADDIFAQLQNKDLQRLQVGVDELVPVTATGQHGQTLFQADQAQPLPLLGHPQGSFFECLLQRECFSQLDDSVNFQLIYENALSEALKALVLKGHGIAWLPKSLLSRELAAQELVIIEGLPSIDLRIELMRLRKPGQALAEDFWQHLMQLYDGNA